MIPREKTNKIAQYLKGASDFDDLSGLKPAILDWRPAPEMWTIREHIIHLMDAEIATFHRYRKAIAEPGGKAIGFDEEKWTALLGYENMDVKDALAIFKLLRKMAAAHLSTLVDRDWSDLWFAHDQQGKVNLETWISNYINHAATHREYIDRNLKLHAQKK